MIKMRNVFTLIPAFLILLTGCVSSSGTGINYYLLAPIEAGQDASKSNLKVGVGPVEIAEYLDRPYVLTQTGTSTLNAKKSHRWAGPLKNNISETLATNISSRLGHADVAVYPWESGQRINYQVIVHISRFIASGNSVYLEGRWRLFNKNGKQLSSQRIKLQEPLISDSYDDIVSAMSGALAQLSNQIATRLR